MVRFVVDASLVVKWIFVEVHTEAALRLAAARHDLAAPDLLLIELGNVAWKKVRRRQLDYSLGAEFVRSLRSLPIRIERSGDHLALAWEIAVRHGLSVYDGLYLALAVALDAPLVTADRRLYDSIARSDLGEHVLWIEDLPG